MILKVKSNEAMLIMHSKYVVTLYTTRFSSGPLTLLEPSTNSVLLSLC